MTTMIYSNGCIVFFLFEAPDGSELEKEERSSSLSLFVTVDSYSLAIVARAELKIRLNTRQT